MKTPEALFITGVTGAVGSWLAGEALRSGTYVRALVRAKTAAQANRRLHSVLKIIGAVQYQERISAILGDIRSDDLGLSCELDSLKECRAILHCAACTKLYDTDATQSYETNVEGTRQVLKLAERLALPIIHVSTAYVAGRRRGLVREDELNVGQTFHNVYEQTKCQAEALVRQWSQDTGLGAIILRPSIVVGDWIEGRTVRFGPLYDLMRLFEKLAPNVGGENFRIVARADATKNFVPVDYMARASWHIIMRNVPGTYHITHPQPVTLAELRDIFENLFRMSRIQLVHPDTFSSCPPTAAERSCRRAMSIYEPYFTAEPHFDRSHTDEALAGTNIELPRLDAAFFARLLSYARSVGWGRACQQHAQRNSHFPASIETYFQQFLPDKMHRQLLPNLRGLNGSFRIVLKEFPEVGWSLTIASGVLTSISRGPVPVQCCFVVDQDAFAEIVAGRLTPQQAFFQRKVEIEGDIETGLRIATVLAEFFRRFPYEVKRD